MVLVLVLAIAGGGAPAPPRPPPRLPPSAIRKAVSNVRRKGVLGQKTLEKMPKNETPLLGELSEQIEIWIDYDPIRKNLGTFVIWVR